LAIGTSGADGGEVEVDEEEDEEERISATGEEFGGEDLSDIDISRRVT
jgi:hypothetical protein